ncbi:MAG: hypothetical protein AB4368_32395 [Xenococcaceae cyanobacterium]
MKFSRLTFLLAILAFLLPVSANGNGVDVQTGNVRVSTERDGSAYVRTGNTSLEVSPQHSSRPWYSWQNWRLPWSRSCHSQVYQRTTQTTRSGERVIHSTTSTSSNNCR